MRLRAKVARDSIDEPASLLDVTENV